MSLTARKYHLYKHLIKTGGVPLSQARTLDQRVLRGAFLTNGIIVSANGVFISQQGYDEYKLYNSVELSRKNAEAPMARVFKAFDFSLTKKKKRLARAS